MQFWVYLLRCSDGTYYAGHTDDLDARLWQHQQGIACDWTKRRRPITLGWCSTAPTREEALAFERRIKGWTRAKKEALIAGDWGRIHELSSPVRAERRAQPEVEAREAQPSEKRPSTSLRTNDVGVSK